MKNTEIVTTFEAWTEAVKAEQAKLSELHHYLNEKGLDRYSAFTTLLCLADYCADARELVEWIDSKEDLNKREIADLESFHAAQPIKKLRRIAEQEVAA